MLPTLSTPRRRPQTHCPPPRTPLHEGHLHEGGAGKQGLGYPSLKVSSTDRAASLSPRPYLPKPPRLVAWQPGGGEGPQHFLGFYVVSYGCFSSFFSSPDSLLGSWPLVIAALTSFDRQTSSCSQRRRPGVGTCVQVRVCPGTGQTAGSPWRLERLEVKRGRGHSGCSRVSRHDLRPRTESQPQLLALN